MNFKIYKKKNKYYIYNVYGKCMASCTNEKVANYIKELLEKDTVVSKGDIEIIEKQHELNDIPECRPANNNSRLNSALARKTRELLGKDR